MMAKVVNPLGSSEAHGRVGRSIIFQGTTAKIYRVPVIEKVQGQLDTQDKFQSVTKTLRLLGLWGRGTLQTIYGNGWFGLVFKDTTLYWGDAEVVFNGFTQGHQDQWTAAAPFVGTTLERGLTFFAICYAIDQAVVINGLDGLWYDDLLNRAADVYSTWWGRTLDNVFCEGIHDSGNPGLEPYFLGEYWSKVSNANAYQGSYLLSEGLDPTMHQFFVYGTGLTFLYHQAPMQAVCYVRVDSGDAWAFSQNDVNGFWQATWRTPTFQRGLHIVTVTRTGAEGPINLDGVVVHG